MLALALALCLGGCSNIEDAVIELLPQRESFVELDTSSLGKCVPIRISTNDKYTVINYTNQNGEVPEGEEENQKFYLALFSNRTKKLLANTEYKNENFNWYSTSITPENEILLDDEFEGVRRVFDVELNEVRNEKFEIANLDKKAEKIKGIDTNRFVLENEYANSYDGEKYTAFVFYDEPENYYLAQLDCYTVQKNVGHSLLTLESNSSSAGEIIKIYDLDTNTQINSLSLDADVGYSGVLCSEFLDNTVSFCTVDDIGYLSKACIWYYTREPSNVALDSDFCLRISTDDIKAKTDELAKEIEELYDIHFAYDVERSFFDIEVENGFLPILYYINMQDIKEYLSYFPKELYKEILCNDIKEPVCEFDEFWIYLVSNVSGNDGTVAAYAANVMSEETNGKDVVYIVYSCTNLSLGTYFHELMHTMEYRIWNYDKDFDVEWGKLNPKDYDYEYTEEYDELYMEHEDWQSYFVRGYGLKNNLEDRADCFSTICESSINKDISLCNDKKPLKAKLELLLKTLKASYPSLEKSDFNWII